MNYSRFKDFGKNDYTTDKHINLGTYIPSVTFRNVTEDDKIRAILKDSYPVFIQKLGNFIKDPKFQSAIKSLAAYNKITFKNIEPSITDLLPTQNEIDMTKSLSFPLKDPETARKYLRGGVVSVAGNRIVTSNNGRYIIDGHHRWSQLYVINSNCYISAVDLSDIKDPIEALKNTQLGIGGDIGSIPTAVVKGTNLITCSKETLIQYVKDTITPEVIQVFSSFGKGSTASQIGEYIWQNVSKMQTYNKPIPGAPSRSLMPQTDMAPEWKNFSPNM